MSWIRFAVVADVIVAAYLATFLVLTEWCIWSEVVR